MMRFFKLEAVLVLVAVVAVAFVPAVRGPYSAVHGPITALRTMAQNLFDKLRIATANGRGYCPSEMVEHICSREVVFHELNNLKSAVLRI